MNDLELEKYVDYVFKTPSGGIVRVKTGGAIIIRGNDAELLSSLEDYHDKKYKSVKDDTRTWKELTDVAAKTKFLKANAASLRRIKWIEVEAAQEHDPRELSVGRELEASERRKRVIDWLGEEAFKLGLGTVLAMLLGI
jgi:hypothetical protein